MTRLKQLAKDSVIYGIGGALAKGVSFFLLPIYTHIFSPADYGTIEMLTMMSNFIAAILVMGMDSAQSMYFFKHKGEGEAGQAKIVSSILQWRIVWGLGIVLISTIFSPFLNSIFFNGKLNWTYFAMAFFGALFAQIMSQSAEVMRLLYRPWGYIGVTLAQSLLSAALILAAVLVFNHGIFGFFLGTAISSLLVAAFGWYRIRRYIRFERLYIEWWPQLIRFGAPLVPAGLAMYFMNTADRWFVEYYHGEEALGIFAIGAKFALLMTLAVETFRTAWWPIAMDAMHSDDGPETFRLIARLYMGIGTGAVVMLALLSPWLVRWLTAPAFYEAWPVVGILSWQALFYGFYLIASIGIWKAEKTYLNLYIMGSSAALGLGLNWLLVPNYGGVGAAVATAVAYSFWTFVSMAISEMLWRVSFPIGLFICQISAAALYTAFVCAYGSSVSSFVLAVVLIVAFVYTSLDYKVRNMIITKIQKNYSLKAGA